MDLEQEKEQQVNLNHYLEKKIRENFIESLQQYVDQIKEGINQQEIKLKEHIAIDRMEENIAVCELSDGSTIDVLKEKFPYEIKPGDVIQVEFCYKEGKQTRINILKKDEEEKLRRIQMVKEKMEKIKNNLSSQDTI